MPAIVVVTIAMETFSLICSLWDGRGVVQHKVARAWARTLMALGFVRCRVSGLEKLDPNGSYVLVANHRSYLDSAAILSAIPLEVRFFAKTALFSIPFLGWHLRRAGHLPVERGDARASLKSMSDGARLIKERGISLLVFPEGGRAEGKMRPFKEGAAYIAIKAGVAVVPIGITNSQELLPLGTLLMRPGTMELRVGDPIETAGMTAHERARLNQMMQERVAELAA